MKFIPNKYEKITIKVVVNFVTLVTEECNKIIFSITSNMLFLNLESRHTLSVLLKLHMLQMEIFYCAMLIIIFNNYYNISLVYVTLAFKSCNNIAYYYLFFFLCDI